MADGALTDFESNGRAEEATLGTVEAIVAANGS
jgi:hypothetical protein